MDMEQEAGEESDDTAVTEDEVAIPTIMKSPDGETTVLFIKPFMDAVYNETVNIVEIQEGLDGETFSLYIFMAALVVFVLVLGQHFLISCGRKPRKQQIERGTTNFEDVDFEWVPKETLNMMSKSRKQ